ncbi:cofactor assembly of complex C subunit B [Nodosilinea sp. FACHB-131]|uniref:cofactor assembly of complex C subunit B n=1 Tax=Cyanophyceae TaxID=3028117 RepID=UPI0016831E46|nr:cofactor assembly of complex C subunit B [Nodosilinea sp. FACHB-131]MBD1876817.1 cofactor assembly of complex C subunit B [Nodosilinea sp. FACHB-131]
MAQNDPNRVLRLLPLVTGGLGGTLLLINRVLTPALTESQARSDVMGVILSALLILTGLLWQRVQPTLPEAVTLIGAEGLELDDALPDAAKTELAWASHLLLTNTVTRSVVVYRQGKTLLRRGILAPKAEVTPGPILRRVLETGKAVYLVKLSIYPGRVEFDYLPENTQGVICQPMGQGGALILAANAPRSYTRQDEAWIEGIADKLGHSLGELAWEKEDAEATVIES